MKSWLIGKTLMLGKTEGRRRSGQQRMRWLSGITNAMAVNLSKLLEIIKNREAWYAAVHGAAKSWTWLRDWKTIYDPTSVPTIYWEGKPGISFTFAAASELPAWNWSLLSELLYNFKHIHNQSGLLLYRFISSHLWFFVLLWHIS